MKHVWMVGVILLAALGLGAQEATPGKDHRALRPQQGTEQPAGKEARVALVIGNAAYPDASLKNPVNDAKGVKEALERCKFQVTLLTDATKRQMEDAIAVFGDRIRGGGVGLFYFAGHGLQVKGDNYLVPIGAKLDKEEDVPYEGVNVGRVLDRMDAAKNVLNILILDACRNNPFARSWHRGWGEPGLASVNAPSGSLIAYATAPGSTAADGDGENGLYTAALLKELEVPGVPLLNVFQDVRKAVKSGSQGLQTPWESNSTVGDFYFRPQRTAEELAREQAAVQAETSRLEAELQAKLAETQTAEAGRQADQLKARLRAQELERQRLAQEESRRQELEAETRRAQAEDARLLEERSRLEALKQRLARAQGPVAGGQKVATLAEARQALARLTSQRDEALQAIQQEKARALLMLDYDYAGLRERLEAPRDEFETTSSYQEREKRAADLQAKRQKERAGLEAHYAEMSTIQTRPVDTVIAALKTQAFPVTYPVEWGAYDADRGQYAVRIPVSGYCTYLATLALEPAKAKALKERRDLVKAEADSSLASRGVPDRLSDPVLGLLPLNVAKVDVTLPSWFWRLPQGVGYAYGIGISETTESSEAQAAMADGRALALAWLLQGMHVHSHFTQTITEGPGGSSQCTQRVVESSTHIQPSRPNPNPATVLERVEIGDSLVMTLVSMDQRPPEDPAANGNSCDFTQTNRQVSTTSVSSTTKALKTEQFIRSWKWNGALRAIASWPSLHFSVAQDSLVSAGPDKKNIVNHSILWNYTDQHGIFSGSLGKEPDGVSGASHSVNGPIPDIHFVSPLGEHAPSWIDNEEVPEGIAAVGIGSLIGRFGRDGGLGGLAASYYMALEDAATKLAGKLEVRVGSHETQTGPAGPGVRTDKAKDQTIDTNLKGLTVASVWIDPEDKTLYLLAKIPVPR
jgi:hypothetical protein